MATTINLTVPPTEYPVSTEEQKAHSVILHDEDDVVVEQCIAAATESAEMFLRRRLVTQTWTMYIDFGFPNEITINYPPLVSVTSIKYIDTDGAQQTLDSSVYTVDAHHEPGRIVRAYQQSWPAVRQIINAIEIEYIAGYGSAEQVPAHLRQAIMILAAHFYEHRELLVVGGAVSHIPTSAYALMNQDRIYLL